MAEYISMLSPLLMPLDAMPADADYFTP